MQLIPLQNLRRRHLQQQFLMAKSHDLLLQSSLSLMIARVWLHLCSCFAEHPFTYYCFSTAQKLPNTEFFSGPYFPINAFFISNPVIRNTRLKFVGIKAKGRISERVFQENKARQILRKTNIFYPLICTRTYAYQGVRNVRFSENQACFVFLKHLF